MTALLKIFQRLISTYSSFGFKASICDLREILRDRFFRSREYCLMVLRPEDFIPPAIESSSVVVSVVEPEYLSPFVDPAIELDLKFLQDLSNVKAVVAKESITGDLLAYGFFSSEQTAIDGEVFFSVPKDCIYLFKFFVLPEARGERVVRRLMAKILEGQKLLPSRAFILMVLANNFLSQHAFLAMGFEIKKKFVLTEGESEVWHYDLP